MWIAMSGMLVSCALVGRTKWFLCFVLWERNETIEWFAVCFSVENRPDTSQVARAVNEGRGLP